MSAKQSILTVSCDFDEFEKLSSCISSKETSSKEETSSNTSVLVSHNGPKLQYDPTGDKYGNHWYIMSRWDTQWFKTEDDANMYLLSVSNYPVYDDEEEPEQKTTSNEPCIEYDPIGKDDKHWFIINKLSTEWYATEEEAEDALMSVSINGDDIDKLISFMTN